MSASTIPIGFPSANGHGKPIAIPKPPLPISTRQRPRWTLAAAAAVLILLLGSLGAFFASRGGERGPIVPAVVQAPAETASPWSQYRNGPGHTGTTTDLGPEQNPGELWSFATGNKINSEAAIVDGVAYIGSGDGFLYALDATTGAERWRFDAGAAVDCGPAVANGMVFITTRNDELIALSTDDGSEQWRFAKAKSDSSAVLDDGRLIMQGNDGNVYALDPATGDELWRFDTGLTTGRTPAYVDGIVLAGTEEGTLFAIDATDGTERWSFASKGGLMLTTVVDRGAVYQAISDGAGNGLYALDLQSGIQRWSYHALDNASIGVPTVDGNTVYFTSDDGRLYALDTGNGVVRWLVTQLAPWQADGKVAGDYFYIYHSGERKLFAFEKGTGQIHWEIDGIDFVAKGPSITGGVLYASTVDGVMHAIASNTGAERARQQLPHQQHRSPRSSGRPTATRATHFANHRPSASRRMEPSMFRIVAAIYSTSFPPMEPSCAPGDPVAANPGNSGSMTTTVAGWVISAGMPMVTAMYSTPTTAASRSSIQRAISCSPGEPKAPDRGRWTSRWARSMPSTGVSMSLARPSGSTSTTWKGTRSTSSAGSAAIPANL